MRLPCPSSHVAFMLAFIFWIISNASCYDQSYPSHIDADLGLPINMEPVYQQIKAGYGTVNYDNESVSWSFERKGKSDIGFIYSDGKLEVASKDNFDPTVCDRMEGELGAAIGILNLTQGVSAVSKRRALDGAAYYSGNGLVDAKTWSRCGIILVKNVKYARSIFYFNKSININQSLPDAWNNRGVALRNLGRYKEALASFDRALNLSQNNSIILNNKGESLYRLGKTKDAQKNLNLSCLLDPGNGLAWYNKGVVLLDRGKYADALECFNKTIESDIYNADAWNNKGVSLAKLGRNETALGCFNNAYVLNQRFAGALANRGLVQNATGFEELAEVDFAAAEKLGYKRTTAFFKAKTMPPALLEEKNRSPGPCAICSLLGLLLVGFFCLRLKSELL